MSRIRIKNVGPIKNGLEANNGFINFNGVTIFVGNQGSGKSTVAKIYSTMSWLEKALVRGDFSQSHLAQYNRFKKQLAYQNISNYLNEKSEIDYIGEAYSFRYHNNKLEIIENEQKLEYNFPKIMYVPAERNFVSSVDRPDLVKRLPLPLYTFLDEYEDAKQNIGDGTYLPLGNVKFEYRKQNKKSWLVGEDYKINLLEASSGFQSVVPLFLVTQHLTKIINTNGNSSRKEISIDEEKKIRKEIDKIFGNANISEDVRRVLLEKLSARFKYACFLNIVEEPEQNLYPISQKAVLFELLKSKNNLQKNKLVITTHSPYIINYLTLAIKASFVKEKIRKAKNKETLFKELSSVVPLDAVIDSSFVSIYQLNSKGSVKELEKYNGLPSDENYLNEFLAESNDFFIKLMEIEDKCSFWIAKINNLNQENVVFYAIDNCVTVLRPDGKDESRCDGVLSYANKLIFVELKSRKSKKWFKKGREQLTTTINYFRLNHDVTTFKKIEAYVCNNLRPLAHVGQAANIQKFKDETGFILKGKRIIDIV